MHFVHSQKTPPWIKLVNRALVFFLCGLSLCAQAQTDATDLASQLVEFSGKVEVYFKESGDWHAATPGVRLRPGDRLRTGADCRATLRLSDKSVVRIDENTVVEITPPLQAGAKSRFQLRRGSLFFLNREQPAAIEFETPLATGAIRGTEFLLTAEEGTGSTLLALFDGAVELRDAEETISLSSGQQAILQPGRRAVLSAALPARNLIQWTFYYPGVLNLADLAIPDAERTMLADAFEAYRQGDLLQALAKLPETAGMSDAARAFGAALKLSVGRVDEAEALLARVSNNFPPGLALREVVTAVRFDEWPGGKANSAARTSSEWLAHSYYLQSRSDLPGALAAAREAVKLAPEFGFAWARAAELEFDFEHRRAAQEALAEAGRLCPRNAAIFVLEGFVALDEARARAALDLFRQATALDGALGSAWLGRGLAREQLGEFKEGRRDLETAAALEPQRSLFRSYLGKAFAQAHEDRLAEKDFRLAKQFDPGDPTPWLYSALQHDQLNRPNDAVREIERSIELNDNRSVFRSRLLLDRDRAVRSADLAAIYDEAGLHEFGRVTASRAVDSDYANFSGHLFLARSLQAGEDPNGYDLRLETPRQSELLVANLLAPSGGGNLSQLLSQQDHLQFFDVRPAGASTLTEYSSRGDWSQSASVFGTLDGLSYALDGQYVSQHGQRANNDLEQTRLFATAKQQLTPDDGIYLQVSSLNSRAGDVAQYYDPASANAGFRVQEKQWPDLYAGYHHQWAPGSDTLFLFSHLSDKLSYHNPQPGVLFLQQSFGTIVRAETQPDYDLNFQSDFALNSFELQQIWEGEHNAIIAGARYQRGSVATSSLLLPPLPSFQFADSINPNLERANWYAYYQFRPISAVTLTAGADYDRVRYPENADLPPLTDVERSRSLLSPKFAFEVAPWNGGHLRGAYTKSLGGLYFDNSIRLEPAQLAGFTTAFRSLAPESVVGLVPGTEFETWGLGFDQSFKTGTYFGISGELLKSDGERGVGALSNSLPIPLPDTPTSTQQAIDYRERNLSVYFNQLIRSRWSLGASYRLSEAELHGQFTDLPVSAPGVEELDQNERAVLGHLQLSAGFNHECGFFALWQSDLFHQNNFGYAPALADETFWQHNIFAGYRFAHRRAEVSVGVLNLADQDYRLNPLNLQNELPRTRTFTARVKINF